MKKIIRLTESDLTRIIKRVIKENEEEWISQSEDMEMDSDFSKMEKLKQNDDFQRLVSFFKENPDKAEKIQRALEMNVNESYKYYDYGDNKKEITRNHFLKRKLTTYGLSSLLAGIVGYMMGTMAGDDVLQAALLMAGLGGGVLGTLSSEVGRERVKDDEKINESDLTRIIKQVIKENKESFERKARMILNRIGYTMSELKQDKAEDLARILRQESKDRFGKEEWEKLANKLEN
jgi:hypothetical protein